MPRQRRVKDDYGTYYIYQKSGGTRRLFQDDQDKERFLTILAKAQEKYHFALYAYCILSNDEYHLVMGINGGDLSKIMKSINIAYAMYANCEGKLFKDRFKSELLSSQNKILEVIDNIHHRYQEHSLWNSYCTFNGFTPLNLNINQLTNHSIDKECTDCIKTIDEAKDRLTEIALKEHKTLHEIIKNKNTRNQLIRDFRKQSTLSLKELGIVFGGLSESSICKILNQ